MHNPAVEVNGLCKSYGDVVAVDDISLTVSSGEIFGLLGPNGAGKTTTLECLEGLRRADSGYLRVMGVDPSREPRRLMQLIGVQLQTGALPDYISVSEAMRLFSVYHRVAPDYELLERIGLGDKMNAQYHTLSTGQKRRLALALALAHRPPVIFLDEPTAGLDVASRVFLHSLIKELRQEGTTIILSTHDMAEAEHLTDRVAILLRGRLVADGSPRRLTATGSKLTKVTVRTAGESLAGASFPGVERVDRQDEYAVYFTVTPGPTVTALIGHIEKSGDELIDLRVERPSLEECFLELTAEEAVS